MATSNLHTQLTISAGVDGINDVRRLADTIEQAGGNVDELRQSATALESAWGSLSTDEQTRRLNQLSTQAERLRQITSARTTLRLTGDDAVRQQIQNVTAAYQTLQNSGTLTTAELARATHAYQAQLQRLQNQLQSASQSQEILTQSSERLQSAWQGLGGLMATLGVSLGVAEVVQMADEFNTLEAKIKLATGGGVAFADAMKTVRVIAEETQMPLTATGDLFAKLTGATKELGLSQHEVLELTRTINKAMSVSGGSAASMEAAITQLAQGLSAGALRGDEFNSVVEQSPRLAKAMADGLGVNIGKLRQMAGEGKLTAEVVANALKSQAQTIADEYAQMPTTVSSALTVLKNTILGFIGDMDNELNSSSDLANFILKIGEGIENIDPAILISVKDVLGQFGEVVKVVYDNVVLTKDQLQSLLNAFAGISKADEQVSFLTRTIQGLAIVTGTVADGVKALGIVFETIIGFVSREIGRLVLAFSMITGQGRQMADSLIEQGNKWLANAQKNALAFESSTKQALDNATKTSGERLQEMANHAKSTYNAMVTSGKASAQQLQEAFADYALKAIKANRGVVDATLKNELAQHQLQAVVSKTGEVSLQTYADLTQSINKVDFEKFKGEFETLKVDMNEFATGVNSKVSQSLQAFNQLATLAGDNVVQLALAYQGAKTNIQGNQAALLSLEQALLQATGGNQALASAVQATAAAQQNAKNATDEQKKALDALGVSIDAANAKMSTSGHKMAQNLKVGLTAIKEQVKGADELKASVATALDTSLASAKTVADFKAIEQAIKDAGLSSQVSSEHMKKIQIGMTDGAEGVKALNDKLKEQTKTLTDHDSALTKTATAAKNFAKAQHDGSKSSSDMAKANQQATTVVSQSANGFASGIAKIVGGIRSQMAAMTSMGATGEQLNQVFDKFGKIASSRYKGIMQLGAYFKELDNLTKSAVKSMADMDAAVAGANQSLSAQTVTMTDLTKAQHTLQNATNFNIMGIVKLDKSKLQGLQAQIAKAEQQMQDFSDTAKQTMQDLDSELATLQGREMDALRIKQAQKLADLQAKMAEATARGNGEEIAHYSKAISLQKQINAEQTRQGVQKALQERQPIVSAETKSIQSISAADVVSGFNARIEQAKQEAKEEGRQEFAKELLDNVKRRAR